MHVIDAPYGEWVLPHAYSPRFRSETAADAGIPTVSNPTCDGEVQLAISVDPDSDLMRPTRCASRGRPISQAAASGHCEFLTGQYGQSPYWIGSGVVRPSVPRPQLTTQR